MKCLEIHKKMLSSLRICKLKSCLKAKHKSKHKWESISTPDLNERDTDTIFWREVFLRYFSIKINLGSVEKIIYFIRGHIDTYLWWNRSPNCRILFFACFTNSSRSPLWNTSQSQERLLESLLISTLQILGNSRWYPTEMAYFERVLKTIRMFTYCV